jgi:O-antigen/teichoic acid export membrane protein
VEHGDESREDWKLTTLDNAYDAALDDGDTAPEVAASLGSPGGGGDQLRRSVLTVACQAVSSATTFFRMVLLARVCSSAEVGLYAMSFTAVLLMFVSHERLIESSYLVAVHRRRDGSQRSLLGSAIVFSMCFAVLGAVFVALVAGGAALLGGLGWLESSGPMATALLATALATPPIVLREMTRSVAFAHFDVANATIIDVATLIVQAGLLVVFWQMNALNVETTYVAIAVSSLVGCLWWAYSWRGHWVVERDRLGADWREMWSFSRWLLAARVLGQGSRFIMPWVVAAYLGAAGAGVLATCLTLVGLSWIFVRGINNYFRPAAVYAFHHGGGPAVRRAVWRTSWIFGGLLGALCIVYAVAGDWLFELAYGSRPDEVWLVIVLQGINTLASSLAIAPTNGLAAIDRPRPNLWIEGLTFVVTAALAPVLVPTYGLAGASVAMLAGNVVGAIAAFAFFESELRRLDAEPDAPPTISGRPSRAANAVNVPLINSTI